MTAAQQRGETPAGGAWSRCEDCMERLAGPEAGAYPGSGSVMKVLRVAVLFLFLSPASAWAGDVTLRARDVPLGRVVKAPLVFETVGVHWRGDGRVELRARSVTGRWGAWRGAQPEGEDLPDGDSAENRRPGWHLGNPWYLGRSTALQLRARGVVTKARAFFVHTPQHRIPLRRLSIAGSPTILTRSSWSANEA